MKSGLRQDRKSCGRLPKNICNIRKYITVQPELFFNRTAICHIRCAILYRQHKKRLHGRFASGLTGSELEVKTWKNGCM